MSSSWSMRLSEGVEEPHSALSTLRNFQKKITEHVITLGGNPEEALATLNQSASLNRNESFSDYSTHAAQCTSITCIDKVPYISDNSNCNDGQNVDVHNISIQRRLALHEDRRKAYLEGKSIPSSLNVHQGTSHAMESRSHTRLALFDPRNLPFEVHESPFQVTSIEQGVHQYSAVVETQPSYTAACRELPNNRNTFDPMVIPFPVTTSPFEERAASLQAMQTIQTRKTNRRAPIKNSLTKHADPTQTLVIPEIPNQLEEHDWSHVPRIPVPEEMQRKQWWQCKGHDYILQLMEAWGKTPTNSPSLAEEIMTHELISCFEALELGEQVVLYQEDEPPHERFFYIKLLRCRKRGRMLPFLCWAQHNRSSSALDFISLLDLVYAHHGPHSELFMNYTIHNNGMLKGPKAGNKRRILMPNGALSLWFLNDHDPSRMRSLDMLTLEPLSLARWLYLFENVSALNAMLDVSGQMRHAREHLRDTMTMKVRQGTRGQILDYTPGSRCPVDI